MKVPKPTSTIKQHITIHKNNKMLTQEHNIKHVHNITLKINHYNLLKDSEAKQKQLLQSWTKTDLSTTGV